MSAPITTAMVLAAGLGTRMRPLTLDRPKALVEVGGRALIDHMLDRLQAAGVTRAVVNVHAFADRLEAHLRHRSDLEVVISDERDALLETGGGIVKALPHFAGQPFFCANIDSLWRETQPPSLQALATAFDTDRMDGVLWLADRKTALGYAGRGDASLDPDGRLQFRGDRPEAPYVYCGVQILHPRLFADATPGRQSLHPFWQRAERAGRLYGLPMPGRWMHVGDPDARADAEAAWA